METVCIESLGFLRGTDDGILKDHSWGWSHIASQGPPQKRQGTLYDPHWRNVSVKGTHVLLNGYATMLNAA